MRFYISKPHCNDHSSPILAKIAMNDVFFASVALSNVFMPWR
jgi:hypothetical protein